MNWHTAITLVAAGLTLVAGLPQLWRTLHSSNEGVSAGTWATLTGVGALWTIWAIPSGVWPMVVSEGIFTISAAVIAIRSTRFLKALFMACFALGALYLVWFVGGAVALGIGAVAGSIACRVPQLIKAWKSPDVSGIAGGSWFLLLAANSFWAIAGIGTHNLVLFLGGFLSGLSSVLVIFLSKTRGRNNSNIANISDI